MRHEFNWKDLAVSYSDACGPLILELFSTEDNETLKEYMTIDEEADSDRQTAIYTMPKKLNDKSKELKGKSKWYANFINNLELFLIFFISFAAIIMKLI